MEINIETLEQTGANFSLDSLMGARSKTKEAISLIANDIKPGMLEEDARQMAKETLDRLGSQKGWHKILVRFGTNTIKNFEDPSERDMRLHDGDIFLSISDPSGVTPRVTAAKLSWSVKIRTPTCFAALVTSN